MDWLRLLVILNLVYLSVQQITVEPKDDDDNDTSTLDIPQNILSSIYGFRYEIKPEKTQKLVIDMSLENRTSIKMLLKDVVREINIHNISSETLADASERLNLEFDDVYNVLRMFDLPTLLRSNLETTFNTSIGPIMDKLTKTLGEDVEKFIAILNITSNYFKITAVGSSTEKVELLLSGDWSKTNIQKLSEIISLEDVFEITSFKNIFLNLEQLSDDLTLRNMANTSKVTTTSIIKTLEYLKVDSNTFRGMNSVQNTLNDLSNSLNKAALIGTAIGGSKLVTKSQAKMFNYHIDNETKKFIKDYTNIRAATLFKPEPLNVLAKWGYNIVFELKNLSVFSIKEDLDDYVYIANKYNNETFLNCTYLSASNVLGLHVEFVNNVTITEVSKSDVRLEIPKRNNTVYIEGSPLFCNNMLYGITIEEHETHIHFATMLGEDLFSISSGYSFAGHNVMFLLGILTVWLIL